MRIFRRRPRRQGTLVELDWVNGDPVALMVDPTGDIDEVRRWLEAWRLTVAPVFPRQRRPELTVITYPGPGVTFTAHVSTDCVGTCGHRLHAGSAAISAHNGLFCSPNCAEEARRPPAPPRATPEDFA